MYTVYYIYSCTQIRVKIFSEVHFSVNWHLELSKSLSLSFFLSLQNPNFI